jgi:hypothetical protein
MTAATVVAMSFALSAFRETAPNEGGRTGKDNGQGGKMLPVHGHRVNQDRLLAIIGGDFRPK